MRELQEINRIAQAALSALEEQGRELRGVDPEAAAFIEMMCQTASNDIDVLVESALGVIGHGRATMVTARPAVPSVLSHSLLCGCVESGHHLGDFLLHRPDLGPRSAALHQIALE